MVSYAFQEIRKRKKKYLLNIIVIGLVVFLLISLNSLGKAYNQASKLPFEAVHSSIIIQKNGNVPENTSGTVLSCSLAAMPSTYLEKIKKMVGVTDVSSGLFLWVFDSDNFKRVLGVNWNDALGQTIETKLVAGLLPKTAAELLVEKTYANQYKIGTGNIIMISGTNFTVSGIVGTSGKDIISSDAYVSLKSAQNLAYASPNLQQTERFEKDDINIIFVNTEQTKVNEVAKRLNILLNSNTSSAGKTPIGQTIGTYNIYTPASFENQISSLFTLTNKIMLMISAVILIGAVLLIAQNMSHTINERRKEIGIMKSVGFRNKDIQQEIIAEIFIQIIIGYVVGLLVALLVIASLSTTTISINIPWGMNPYPHFLSSAPESLGTTQTYRLPISFDTSQALLSLGLVLAIGLGVSAVLIRRINKLKAMEALRYE